MICIIAGNYHEAEKFARAQMLDKSEWFYPADVLELKQRKNFHVLVVGTAGENVPQSYFEKVYAIARERGRLGRT